MPQASSAPDLWVGMFDRVAGDHSSSGYAGIGRRASVSPDSLP